MELSILHNTLHPSILKYLNDLLGLNVGELFLNYVIRRSNQLARYSCYKWIYLKRPQIFKHLNSFKPVWIYDRTTD